MREQKAAVPEVEYSVETDVDVLASLDRLSERQRAVVVLAYWESMTASEIGKSLGISEGSVKRHLDRAKSRLRKDLSKEYLV